jgi:hypothetical protein
MEESKKTSSDKISTQSKKSSKKSAKPQIESEDISLSQLEVMANKKKLKKSSEISISEANINNVNKVTEPKPRSSNSSVSIQSIKVKDKSREKEVIRENQVNSIRREKAEYLYKLDKLYTRNKSRSVHMDMDNSLNEIRNEYERISNEMKTERSVAFFKRMLLLGVQGIEMMNNKFDPLGVDLDGWSEAMGYSLENQEYDEVMAELYEKYKGAGQMSPEVKLIFMIISSATMFTISKKITKLDSSNAFKNIIGSFVGQQQKSNQQQREATETTEDLRPSKIRAPESNADGIDINNILRTMDARKREKDRELEQIIEERETSDDIFKSIPLNSAKRGRGRPKKNGTISKV